MLAFHCWIAKFTISKFIKFNDNVLAIVHVKSVPHHKEKKKYKPQYLF